MKADRIVEMQGRAGDNLWEMRSRFALTETPDRLAAVFGATASSTTGWKPSYKFGPGRKIIIVRERPVGGAGAGSTDAGAATGEVAAVAPGVAVAPSAAAVARELITATWGFTPTWLSGEVPPIVRVGMERVLTNGYFHDAFVHRRCLVPMLGYYDWQTTPNGDSQSYFVRGPGQVLAAMGIYNVRQVSGRPRLSVALVTRDTGATVDDRVPSIIDEPLWGEWLATDDRVDPQALLDRAASRSHDLAATLTSTRVGDSINSPYARDAIGLISPLRKRA